MKDKIAIGKILTAHGIKGFVKAETLSGETEHFKSLKEVFINRKNAAECLNIEKVTIAHKHVLIKFTGIDTPEKAKLLSNLYLWTEKENACRLNKGEYYLKDICSCIVYLKNKRVGRVKSVLAGGNSDNLEILLDNGKTVIIPFMNHFVGKVNIKEKKIEIKEDYGLF